MTANINRLATREILSKDQITVASLGPGGIVAETIRWNVLSYVESGGDITNLDIEVRATPEGGINIYLKGWSL